MTPPNFDPQRIALEAAEDATRLLSVVCDPEQDGSLCFDYSAITATLHPLILSAAAKMVQQSGAVEALREDIISARIIHSEAEHNGKWAIQRDCAFIEERCYKALDRLRSITGEAGK